MAANRYLTINLTTHEQELPFFNDTSAGVADAGKGVALGSNGLLSPTLFPAGIGETTITAVANEALLAGALVSLRSDGKVENADAGNARAARGFVLSAVASSGTATVYLSGRITGLSSITPGAVYFLGAAGAITLSPISTTNSYLQEVGDGCPDGTSLEFRRGRTVRQ